MKNLQTTGGVASLLLGMLFSGYLLLLAVVLPAQGFGPGTLDDSHTAIPFVATSPLPALIDCLYIGIAIAFLVITMALCERLCGAAPALMAIAGFVGSVASGMFLLYAMINFIGMPKVVALYQHDPLAGETLYLTLRTTANAVNAGAIFAAGWTIVLAGWSVAATNRMRSPLGWLMLGAGVAMIASFVLLPVGLLGVLLAPIWSIWLGVVLLRGNASSVSESAVIPLVRM